ncbi:LysR substrate-binding domain-containing protein [Chelativorans xinjiangense]|uniref:LysR substrate-binding domain-containing protein n=1 Tax=Chelativorans xinjiangense TaxID=2681485 RepID=UPI00135BDACC|nr:LysR substrate-binding domain-containing protein [Chelativorans xinjiangense]
MDIRQLRYFVHIVDCGSLSSAARELYIAQPALSQQIAKLEAEVDRPLLSRSSKGVLPTEYGLALYHHARFMLRQFDQTIEIARGEIGPVQGVVTVGLPATTVAAIGLPLVKRLRERFPSILLNVVEGMSGHIGQLMRLGQLDMAVLFSQESAMEAVIEPLMVEELFLILSLESPLVPAGLDRVDLAKAAALPLILPTRDHGLRQRIEAEFENRGLSANVVAQVDSLSLVMDCVYDGMGATIKPMGAIMKESAGGRRFRFLAFRDLVLRRRNFLYTLPAEQLTPAAAVVVAELRETVRLLITDKVWPGFEGEFPEASAVPEAIAS